MTRTVTKGCNMPKVYLTKEDRIKSKVGAWVAGQLYKEHKSFTDLGEILGVTRQAARYKARNNAFSYVDMVLIFENLGTPDADIAYVMKP